MNVQNRMTLEQQQQQQISFNQQQQQMILQQQQQQDGHLIHAQMQNVVRQQQHCKYILVFIGII